MPDEFPPESQPVVPHLTPEQFRGLGHRMVDWIADYMAAVERFPVQARVEPGQVAARLADHPPRRGLAEGSPRFAEAEGPSLAVDSWLWEPIFADLKSIILPGITHWQSPNFFGFFPANASGPAILGELLSAGLGVNGMLWATSPAATELETRMLDWVAEMVGLPEAFTSRSENGGGVIQGTASESALVAMVAARRRVGGGGAPLVAYASTQAHSSVLKAAMIAGVARGPEDRARVRLVGTDGAHAMRPDLLGRAVREDRAAGRVPFFVCATVGTTSSTAVDPVGRIAEALREAGFFETGGWLHVDAAHAGCACVCPEFRWMLEGVEHADSLCFNPHKWLLTNFDCDCFWTRDRRSLVGALSVTPEYLRNRASDSGAVIDYRDWQIPLGRRFRALKLWFVIRHYGVEGLRAHIREHVRLAGLFESLVREDDRFEIAAPRTINLVCFRRRGEGAEADRANRVLLDRLNASGRLYLTHTTLPGPDGRDRVVLRMAIGAPGTREHHVRSAWDLIRSMADPD